MTVSQRYMAREGEKWMPMERNFEDMSAVTYSHFVCSADKLFILTLFCIHCAEIQHNFPDSFPSLMKGMILSDLLKPNFHNPNQQLRVWIYSLRFAFVISPIKDWAAKVSLSCTSWHSSNLWKRIFCQNLCMTKTTLCPFFLPQLVSFFNFLI